MPQHFLAQKHLKEHSSSTLGKRKPHTWQGAHSLKILISLPCRIRFLLYLNLHSTHPQPTHNPPLPFHKPVIPNAIIDAIATRCFHYNLLSPLHNLLFHPRSLLSHIGCKLLPPQSLPTTSTIITMCLLLSSLFGATTAIIAWYF